MLDNKNIDKDKAANRLVVNGDNDKAPGIIKHDKADINVEANSKLVV